MKNIFYGWYIVGTLIIVGIVASCVRYMLPVFVPSFIQDFNWTRTTIGFVFTLNFWIASAAGPFIGVMIDKVGGRFITTIGGIFLLSSMILLSTMTNITQLYIYFSLIAGLGIACTFYVPLTSIPRKWFIKRAGIAVSLVLMGAGSGLFIAPPIASILINNFGWRMSFIIFGIPLGILSIVVPATVIRNFPESIGLHPDGEIDCFQCASLNKDPSVQGPVTETGKQNYETKEIIRTSSFWFLDLAYGLSHIVLMAIIPYMATWAQDFGIDRDSAAFALLLMGFFSVTSRIVGGVLRDRFGGKVPICIGMFGLIIVSLYGLTVDKLLSLYIFSIAAGLFYGLHLPAWTPLLGDLFGRKSLGTLMGFLSLSFGCISGSGPAIFGWIYDKYGTYNLGFVFGAICCIVTLILVVFIKPLENSS